MTESALNEDRFADAAVAQPPRQRGLPLGARLPSIALQGQHNPTFMISTVAGRWVVLAFVPHAAARAAVRSAFQPTRASLDDENVAFFMIDRSGTAATPAAPDELPGIRYMVDPDDNAAEKCGVPAEEGAILLLDPTLRLVAAMPCTQAGRVAQIVSRLPAPAMHAGVELHAPVLILPRVFEPDLCRGLIALYEREGGRPSGFMREVDGVTRLLQDDRHKRRSDITISDAHLLAVLRSRIKASVVPAIEQAFQFQATRIERFIVACYDSQSGGYFRPHRDNTTKGTAHRRFAVTINLNSEDYEGGGLRFPEFGPRVYRAPTGGAVIFSCSLLHEALPVTAGKRYAFLPFLYDEAAATVREANRPHVQRS